MCPLVVLLQLWNKVIREYKEEEKQTNIILLKISRSYWTKSATKCHSQWQASSHFLAAMFQKAEYCLCQYGCKRKEILLPCRITKSWLGHERMQLNAIKYRKRIIKEEKLKWLFDCQLYSRYSSEKLHFAPSCEKMAFQSKNHIFLIKLFSRSCELWFSVPDLGKYMYKMVIPGEG